MSKTKEIKTRIESVKKTKKITQAMKMVSAAKFKRASTKSSQAGEYLTSLMVMLNELLAGKGEEKNILFEKNEGKKECVLLMTADRGLCGGFNANLIKFANKYINESETTIELYIIGTKGIQAFKNGKHDVIKNYEKLIDSLDHNTLTPIMNELTEKFINKDYRKVTLIYNMFETIARNKVISKQLLPLSIDEQEKKTDEKKEAVTPFYFQIPNRENNEEKLATLYLRFYLYKALLENSASEEGARMAAMEAATDNAGEMIRELTLLFNRTRQAQITTELSEIVAGAEALVS